MRNACVMVLWCFGLAACAGDTLQRSPAYFLPSDNSFDFGDVDIGSSSQRLLTVVNRGEQPLVVDKVEIDTLNGVFEGDLDRTTADVGESLSLKVTFMPSESVRYATVIRIRNNSDNQPMFSFALSGRGIAPDPCKNKVCNEPPTAGRCVDVNVREFFKASGTCQAGTCVYDTETMNCEFGCDANTGACKGDPCANVICQTPPSSPCFFTRGECVNGACQYQPRDDVSCDDSNACTTGDRCLGGGCYGSSKVCEAAPVAACIDSQRLRIYDPVGVCTQDTGACEYTQREQYCAYGCGRGRCNADPCEGVVCTAPPGVCYSNRGYCDRGVCRYDALQGAACDDRDPCTLNDTCGGGTCRGTALSCNTPPASVCSGAQTLTTYSSPGVCRTGACEYGQQSIACEFGCSSNTCAAPPPSSFDTVRLEIDVDKDEGEIWEFDSRDASLRLRNPLDSDCSRTHPSITGWDRVYGTCTVQSRDRFTLHEIITHGADTRGDGAYGVSVAYLDECSNMSCFGGICVCHGTDDLPVTVRLYVNQQLKAQCQKTLLRQGDVAQLMVLQRTAGRVQSISPALNSGCALVTP